MSEPTKFERDVALALSDLIDTVAANRIAPRLAAAIDAAGRADQREDREAPLGYRVVALSLLREPWSVPPRLDRIDRVERALRAVLMLLRDENPESITALAACTPEVSAILGNK